MSVIIPNWNGAQRLKALLLALGSQQPIREVIVVDNGSSDDSVRVAQTAGVRVLARSVNSGFAVAVNEGVRAARSDWLLILNNDVELTAGWLQTLYDAAMARGAFFATGKLLHAADHRLIDGTYDAVCRGGTAWRCGAGQPDGRRFEVERAIQFAPFTALLVRKAAFDRVGLLDERFESYLEDVDFGLRCARIGLDGIFVPAAIGYHQGSATLGRWHGDVVRRISRNQVLLAGKHFPIRYLWPILVAQGLWGLVSLRHGAFGAWVWGKIEGLWMLPQIHERSGLAAGILERSEMEIHGATDLYWKLYFRLTGSRRSRR